MDEDKTSTAYFIENDYRPITVLWSVQNPITRVKYFYTRR